MKTQPISWGSTAFNDPGTRAEDSPGFVDVSYIRDLPGDRTLTWRTSYDEYRFRGIYHYLTDSGLDDNRERDYGDWLGSKFAYRLPDSHSGHVTVGVETQVDLRNMQNVFDIAPVPNQRLLISRPNRYVGLFAQQEWTLGPKWELNVGGRFDWSWLKRDSLSPRASVIYKPSRDSDIKVLYGRGFRNPSTYEMFFADNGLSAVANPALRPETTDTFEVDAAHRIAKTMRLSASVYHYKTDNLIQQSYTASGLVLLCYKQNILV